MFYRFTRQSRVFTRQSRVLSCRPERMWGIL